MATLDGSRAAPFLAPGNAPQRGRNMEKVIRLDEARSALSRAWHSPPPPLQGAPPSPFDSLAEEASYAIEEHGDPSLDRTRGPPKGGSGAPEHVASMRQERALSLPPEGERHVATAEHLCTASAVALPTVRAFLQSAASGGGAENLPWSIELPRGPRAAEALDECDGEARERPFGPPEAWCYSALRSDAICESAGAMLQLVRRLEASARAAGGEVIQVKNRLFRPGALGYRDIVVHVRLPVRASAAGAAGRPGGGGVFRHAFEVRVHHAALWAAAERAGTSSLDAAFRGYLRGPRAHLDSKVRTIETFATHCRSSGAGTVREVVLRLCDHYAEKDGHNAESLSDASSQKSDEEDADEDAGAAPPAAALDRVEQSFRDLRGLFDLVFYTLGDIDGGATLSSHLMAIAEELVGLGSDRGAVSGVKARLCAAEVALRRDDAGEVAYRIGDADAALQSLHWAQGASLAEVDELKNHLHRLQSTAVKADFTSYCSSPSLESL